MILVLVSVGLTAALAGWWYLGRKAPRQDGLTAKEWIASTARKMRTGYSDADLQTAGDALLKLGPNAFPALEGAFTGHSRFVDWLAQRWDRLPRGFQKRLRRPLTASEFREAARGIVNKWPSERRQALGKVVVPRLLATATNPRLSNLEDLVVGVVRDLEPPAELVVPAMRRLLRDRQTRELAVFMLMENATAAAPAVPELIEALSDTNSAVQTRALQTLGLIGPAARPAVPAIEKLLEGPDSESAAESLWRIARQTNTALRILTNHVEDRTGNAAYTLGQLGPTGRPAVPALLAGLDSKEGNVRMNSSRAIWMIAPEHLSRVLAALVRPLTNGLGANSNNPNDSDTIGSAWYAANVLKEMGDDAAPVRWALEMGLGAKATSVVQECRQALEVVGDGTVVPRKPTLVSWFGSTPQLDGVLAPDEWADATAFHGVRNWTAEFSPVSDDNDLSLRAWVKHDDEWLYFAFQVTDDTLYGIDTERWLPKENANAHQLTRDGFPWFGDEIEILLNAPNTWRGDEEAEGNGGSWQMVCNLTKSRAGGIGVGGLLEGEPRSEAKAWDTYRLWIRTGAQKAAARKIADGKGYVIEWAIHFNPCVELAPGKFYSTALGEARVGLNIAIGDLDTPEKGEGNFGNFHHEQWWAGSLHTRTQKNNFGTLRLMGRQPAPVSR